MAEPKITDGARAIGVSDDEVKAVADSPAGLIVVTKDDVAYVVVPEDQPDAAGQTGVMFLQPPKLPYHGTFPVYAQPLEAAPGGPSTDGPEPVPADTSQKDLLAWVGEDFDRATRALEAEQAKSKPRQGVVDALGKRLAALATPTS